MFDETSEKSLPAPDDNRPAEAGEQLLSIGEMSRRYDVTLRALRFYEGRGMLHPIREGVVRLYDTDCRERLQLILRGKKLGFTLTRINEMISANSNEAMPQVELTLEPAQVLEQIDFLQRQRASIELAISELRETHMRLAASDGGVLISAASEPQLQMIRAG